MQLGGKSVLTTKQLQDFFKCTFWMQSGCFWGHCEGRLGAARPSSGRGDQGGSNVERLLIAFPNYITGLQLLVMSSVTLLFTRERSHTCVTSVAEVWLRVSFLFLEGG